MTERVDVASLTYAPRTSLITLNAKAVESRSPSSILKDRFAAEALERLDLDVAQLEMPPGTIMGLAVRARWFDDRARGFLAASPTACVLNLGCGLDSRVFRVAPSPDVAWFDLDMPEIIDLRRRLYPERVGCRLIASSVTDPEWIEQVPRDLPTLVLAEGMLLYLPSDEVIPLLRRLVSNATSGEICFDGYSRAGAQLIGMAPAVKATGATVTWSLDYARALEYQVPGIRLVEETLGYAPDILAQLSQRLRLVLAFWSSVPHLLRTGRLLRYAF